jgi:hypothetical protein
MTPTRNFSLMMDAKILNMVTIKGKHAVHGC